MNALGIVILDGSSIAEAFPEKIPTDVSYQSRVGDD